jgi:hypothetical protein
MPALLSGTVQSLPLFASRARTNSLPTSAVVSGSNSPTAQSRQARTASSSSRFTRNLPELAYCIAARS